MVLSEATTKIRELARTSSAALNDTRIMQAINEAMNTFAIDVCSSGLHKDSYLTVTPKFTTATNFAIRVTITGGTNALAETDIAITTTARSGVAGATIASDLQATLRTAIGGGANLTVTWSTTDWTFTIDSIDGTAITIQAPTGITYVDATEILFGGTSSGTQTLAGQFPEDCTKEIDLPSDLLSIDAVEWDKCPVQPAPHLHFRSPESFGDPVYYNVQNNKLYLNPVPERQEGLRVWYKYQPTAFTDATTQASTELPIVSAYQMAIVFWAAFYVSESNHESKEADRSLALYAQIKDKYICAQANNNPKMYPIIEERRQHGLDWSTF